MSQVWFFALVASSPLVLGAVGGLRLRLPERILAGMLSFAAGALITAVAYELFEDSYAQGGIWRAGLGMLAGAAVFTALSAMLDRWAEAPGTDEEGSPKLDKDAAATDKSPAAASAHGAAGLALLAAVTLDGVPENVALGVSLTEGTGGLALLAAIFASNLPEAFVGSASMREQGRSSGYIIGTWSSAAALLTLAVVVGAGPLAVASPETISLPLAFAAGAVLASLADTLMPEAYEQGGPLVALSTTAGFVLSFILATL
ncbi:MAG: zinc permease [Nocardioidaceae bacterium]|nr:zinc permease [Nocardioidaceae bacterium]